MPKDYGYFGKGITGYTHYMQAFSRNNGGRKPSGGKGGCLSVLMLLLLSGVLLFSLLIQ